MPTEFSSSTLASLISISSEICGLGIESILTGLKSSRALLWASTVSSICFASILSFVTIGDSLTSTGLSVFSPFKGSSFSSSAGKGTAISTGLSIGLLETSSPNSIAVLAFFFEGLALGVKSSLTSPPSCISASGSFFLVVVETAFPATELLYSAIAVA